MNTCALTHKNKAFYAFALTPHHVKSWTFLPILFKRLRNYFVLLGMLSVILIGTGNVAQHLFDAFLIKKNLQVLQVVGRNTEALNYFKNKVPTSNDYSTIADADIFILAVKDDAIEEVSLFLQDKQGLVAHTSGSLPMNVLQTRHKGVFYPLQTFTKEQSLDLSTIPICVEADSPKNLSLLKTLAHSLSDNVHVISSPQRKQLHLAAVFVNNFANHLYHIADEICGKNKMSFELLHPLIRETVDKIQILTPQEAQTGPAKRNDIETLQMHLDMLENPVHKKVYQLISESIRMVNDEL